MKIKKILTTLIFTAVFSGAVFAHETKNKIGVVGGLPAGLSYTRTLTQLIDFDLIVGFDLMRVSIYGRGAFCNVRGAALFKIWSTPLNSIRGTLSLGPALGFHVGTPYYYYDEYNTAGGFSIGMPVRFELDFSVPCSIFFELVPVGFEGTFYHYYFIDMYGQESRRIGSAWGYYLGGGIGVRYRF